MALLLAKVGLDTIRLVGRWWSDTMIRYLHTTVNIFTSGLSFLMIQHGDYMLIPPAHASFYGKASQTVPQAPEVKGFMWAWNMISVSSAISTSPF